MTFKLPLFPLNLVLFPGTPIALRVFEERYKLMMERCIEGQEEFGVVLIREGAEAFGPLPQPYSVGCMARITKVGHLEDGKLTIMALGLERFRIHALDDSQPYLVGEVDLEPLVPAESEEIINSLRKLHILITRYLNSLSQAGLLKVEAENLPTSASRLAYLGAFLLQVPLMDKQRLLEIGEEEALIEEMETIFRKEIPLLKVMLGKN